jgi:hypothetical protein
MSNKRIRERTYFVARKISNLTGILNSSERKLLGALGGLVDPRFAVSKPVEDDGFLRVIKFRSTTSFGGEVSLRHVKEPHEHERDAL